MRSRVTPVLGVIVVSLVMGGYILAAVAFSPCE
jgi:hypothetical protein